MSTYAPRSSHAQHAPSPAPDGSGTSTLAVPTGRIACEGCAAIVEARLRTSPHVLSVHVDAEHERAQVQVHGGLVSAEELTELVADAYGARRSHSRSRRSRPTPTRTRRGPPAVR